MRRDTLRETESDAFLAGVITGCILMAVAAITAALVLLAKGAIIL